jgi:DNA-binding NtrC family response regulator
MTDWDSPALRDRTSSGKVLLVDDEPEVRRMLRRALLRFGFEVVEATNGRVAVDLARSSDFEVVISDVRMPELGGLGLVERLQVDAPLLPVLLISGFTDEESARYYGAFAFLEKPIQLQELRQVTERAVEAYRERVRAENGELRESGVRILAPNLMARVAAGS